MTKIEDIGTPPGYENTSAKEPAHLHDPEIAAEAFPDSPRKTCVWAAYADDEDGVWIQGCSPDEMFWGAFPNYCPSCGGAVKWRKKT